MTGRWVLSIIYGATVGIRIATYLNFGSFIHRLKLMIKAKGQSVIEGKHSMDSWFWTWFELGKITRNAQIR